VETEDFPATLDEIVNENQPLHSVVVTRVESEEEVSEEDTVEEVEHPGQRPE
jgi:hypothetical protein